MMVRRCSHTFRVRVDTHPAESVCVVGSCSELGDWKRANALHLNKDDSQRDVWSVTVTIPCDCVVEYRYFVCVLVEQDGGSEGETEKVVRYWETNATPRRLPAVDTAAMDVSSNPIMDSEVEEFGSYGGSQRVEQGWLTAETVILLKLFDNPLRLWKEKHRAHPIRIKITPVELEVNKKSGSGTSLDGLSGLELEDSVDVQELRRDPSGWPLVEVASDHSDQCQFRMQEQFGLPYQPDNFVLFRCQTISLENTAFLVDLYQERGPANWQSSSASSLSSSASSTTSLSSVDFGDGGSHLPRHLGFCYVLPSNMRNSCGTAVVPITSVRHAPIGELSVDYTVVFPIRGYECEMRESFARHWKRKGLDVGHRGAGCSFKRRPSTISNIRENTIASLTYAALHGADFVEFDVQLSRDGIPVIYHDFHVCIAMKHKNRDVDDQVRLPVKDLSLEQLHNLKLYNEGEQPMQYSVHEHLEDHQPFPTLEKALMAVDEQVGFNVEVKWTMKLKDGTFEVYHPFELNPYLDTLLETVLRHGGSRRIVFSCFHPDICHMLRLKQNKYPVLFLTQGVTQKYPPYSDPRTNSIPMAVNFALCAGILGINVHTEDILRDPSQVQLALNANLVIFCWGDDNNNTGTIKYLKELGLHGIIYDRLPEMISMLRIDEFGDKRQESEVFVADTGDTQKELMKVAAESSSASPTNISNVLNGESEVPIPCI